MLRACLAHSLVLSLAMAASSAAALDYLSLANNAVVLDANSRLAKPQFILLKGTPVEQLVAIEGWVKIREAGGGIGWVERSAVSSAKQLIVTAPSADVRQAAAAESALSFVASRDVLLEPLEKPAGAWIKVRHRDGRTGFVELRAVWGH